MAVRSFPHLGWDPTPGDVERTHGVARQISDLGYELGTLVAQLDGMDDGAWRGQTAHAFRVNLHQDLVPLLNKARDSFDRAGGALDGWARTLSQFQREAADLELEAARRQQAVEAAARAAASAPESADKATHSRLQQGVDQARSAASQLRSRAEELHERYLQAAKSFAGDLDRAEGVAPDAPGWLDRALGELEGVLDGALESIGRWIRDHAEGFEFFADVMSTISAVAGVLAFIPPLSAIMAPIALIAGGAAAGAEGALLAAGTNNASWTDFALTGGGVVAGFAALKAGKQVVEAYKMTNRATQLHRVRTLHGVVTGQKTDVAPGMFSAARNGASMTRSEVGWRMTKLKADQAGLAATGYGTSGIVDNAKQWGRNTARGGVPWADSGTAPATP